MGRMQIRFEIKSGFQVRVREEAFQRRKQKNGKIIIFKKCFKNKFI